MKKDSMINEYRATPKKIWIHLKTICKHKYWVMRYCFKCGIPWKGIIHDLSKFSPIEFLTNIKYVIPGKSPIDAQKENIGFSMAWQHHKGHNPHHYEFWMDKFDDGCYVTRMPVEYAIEMLCDNLAAGRAYQGKNFSYESEWNWWKKQRTIRNMHPDNRDFLNIIFHALYEAEKLKNDNTKKGKVGIIRVKDNVYTADGKFDAFQFIADTDYILSKKTLTRLYQFIPIITRRAMQVKIKGGDEPKFP